MGWAAYVETAAHVELARRSAAVAKCIANFERGKLDYEYRPEVLEARKPGRARFLAWTECARRVLLAIYHKEGITQSYDQQCLMEEMRNAGLVRMYGSYEAVLDDMPYLAHEWRLSEDKVRDAVAIIYPRRHGKTLTETIVAVIDALSQPDGNVYSYNPTAQHAREWLAQCVRFLRYMANDAVFGFTELSHLESKQIRIRQHIPSGTEIIIRVYGNAMNKRNAQNLRGGGNKAFRIICDEGFFFDIEAFKVIGPTVANGAIFVVASSKPPDNVRDTPALLLIFPPPQPATLEIIKAAMPGTGRPIFNVLDWRRSCDECMALERATNRLVVCSHTAPPALHFRGWFNQVPPSPPSPHSTLSRNGSRVS